MSSSAIGSSFNLKLPAYPAIDEKKYPGLYAELASLHGAIRLLATALNDQNTSIIISSVAENISAGNMVNFFTSGNFLFARNANAVNGTKPCHAFAMNNYSVNQQGQFQTLGVNPFISGLVAGTQYYLSDVTPGRITNTAPGAAGHLIQYVGVAVSSTELLFRPAYNWKQL